MVKSLLKTTRTADLWTDDSIEKTRRTIDIIDTLILDLVRARLGCARWIGAQKVALGRSGVDTEREREVLSNACAHAGESLPLSTTTSLMREMIHLSRIIQRAPRVGFLGPTGTHSEAAARSAFSNYAQYVSFETFEDLCAQLGSGIEFAVIPALNRILGPIAEGLDALRCMPVGVGIERIATIPVRHHLAGPGPIEAIRWVVTRRESWYQCREKLHALLPQAQLMPCSSTARAAAMVAELRAPSHAVLAARASIQAHALPLLAEDLDEHSDNETDFLILTLRERVTIST